MDTKQMSYQSQKLTLPSIPWVMHQTWTDCLFIHYPVKREYLQNLVPNILTIDTYERMGWVTIVPFLMSSTSLRGFPPIPGISTFPGYNVRTYVIKNGKPGVYFFTLAAANYFAARAAKVFFRLPYTSDNIIMRHSNSTIQLNSSNNDLICNYQAYSNSFKPTKGSLDEWLLERYCLYTISGGITLRCNILHSSWTIQNALAEIQSNALLLNNRIITESMVPILHYAKRAEVKIWPPVLV